MLRKKVGLALSGGGLRGGAHIGVLKTLGKHQIPIDFIAGTSAGSIVSSLYALGFSAARIEREALRLKKEDVLDDMLNLPNLFIMGLSVILDYLRWPKEKLPKPPLGLYKGQRLFDFFRHLSDEKTVDETRLPIIICSADLYTGRLVLFTPKKTAYLVIEQVPDAIYLWDVPMALAVRASTSIPGVFEPLPHYDLLLADGAIRNNLPADLLRYAGAEVVIAVDLNVPIMKSPRPDNVVEILLQSVDIMAHGLTDLTTLQYADVIVRPDISAVPLTELEELPEFIARGEEAAEKVIPDIKKLLRA
ncbi:MAG: patatin-like phospholipase family protein [Firmicutes bacterium]|nr:patatin-like phospholipase family protein [Bacillota bacterium]MCL5040090.1 patatin-like phospholipase family protein [Bacillota bacterium]